MQCQQPNMVPYVSLTLSICHQTSCKCCCSSEAVPVHSIRPGSCLHLVVMWAHWRWCTVKRGWVSEWVRVLQVECEPRLNYWPGPVVKKKKNIYIHIISLNAHSLKGTICKIVCCWVSFRSSNTDVLGWWPARPDPTHSNILHTAPLTKNLAHHLSYRGQISR